MSQDNRKFTSPENGKLSQGPKTDEGKQRSAANSTKTGAYSKKLLLDHEDPAELHALHQDLLRRFRPQGPLEEQLVFDMTSLLWRKRRCAPAETALMDLQMQRMSLSVDFEFESITPEARFAVAFNALHSNGESATHLARHERLLFRQFQALRAELTDLQNNRPPSTAPEPPVENPVTAETNLTPSQPVEPTTNTVTNPHASLYASLPPVPAKRREPTQNRERTAAS
jgi:hypothetical protein